MISQIKKDSKICTVFFILTLLFLPSRIQAQGLLIPYFDFLGTQHVTIDSIYVELGSQNAKSQFAFGLKTFIINVNTINASFVMDVRMINTKNLNILNHSDMKKFYAFDFLFGLTLLPEKPTFTMKEVFVRYTSSLNAGFQNFGFGAQASGGFFFSKEKDHRGFMLEFVYRPIPFDEKKPSGGSWFSVNPPDYIYKAHFSSSWSIRAGVGF